MSEFLSDTNQGMVADIIRSLCTGSYPKELIGKFNRECTELTQDQLSQVLDLLHREGVPFQNNPEVIRFYNEIVEEKLSAGELNKYTPGHPVRVYLEENRLLRSLFKEIRQIDPVEEPAKFQPLFLSICDIEKHYVRKENQLFPYLEKHGWDSPSTNMWALHDANRAMIKEIALALKENNFEVVKEKFPLLLSELERMIAIEESRLLPNAMNLLEESEWMEMREGDTEIGWMLKETPPSFPPVDEEEGYVHPSKLKKAKDLPFSTESASHYDEGYLTPEQVNFIFKFLPVDITYVDENDRVVFYNRGEERVFPRSAGIIGREVRFCHPPKSVDTVLRILDEFKKGTKDVADFWINFKDRFIHIRYFAVRDEENYKGVIEMSQDVTDIRALEGENRLLDWD